MYQMLRCNKNVSKCITHAWVG